MEEKDLMGIFETYSKGLDNYGLNNMWTLKNKTNIYTTWEDEKQYPTINGIDWDEPFTIICEDFNDRLITFSYIIREGYPIHDKETDLSYVHSMVDYEENPNIHWDGEDFFFYGIEETPIPSWKFREEKGESMKFRFNK
jgi:hypothetical protein